MVSGKKRDDEGTTKLDGNDLGAGNRKEKRMRPWRISADVPRALLDMVIAGVGYLLSVIQHPI